ncbi:MAG TPA: CHRD domain-containing protein, partial [Burkholderiaceae bacterium]|nr:CHRD domain-containing protein [Burkholderiaceae bacterium]
MKLPTRTAVALSLAFASSFVLAQSYQLKLTGEQENPPVKSTAGGEGMLTVAPDKTLTVNFKTMGLNATAAHIHEGEAGKNGPVAIPL